MKPKFKDLLFASFTFEEYNPLQTKVLLLNAFLFIAVIVNATFVLINLFGTSLYQLASLNLSIFIFSLYALYILREKNDFKRAAYIGNAILFSGFIAIVITQQGQNYTLIWTYFFAPFSILTLGALLGLRVAFTFVTIIFALAYIGVGEWQDCLWGLQSYIRFVIAHLLMLYIIYTIQYANERANDKIEEMRMMEKEQLKRFEKLSVTDPLTSLYNRRFLDEVFPRQRHSAKRHKKLSAFFILDIDYFKQYNDTYGHQQGDIVLVEIAEILQEHLRRSEDYAFRMGGEEFSGIVIGDNEESVRKRINAILLAIEQRNIEHSTSLISSVLTCSVGACILDEASEKEFRVVYREADAALYEAKINGRNRIVYV